MSQVLHVYPNKPGFYWAKWHRRDADDMRWELDFLAETSKPTIVCVEQECPRQETGSDQPLVVLVPGLAEALPVGEFDWGDFVADIGV